MKTIIAVDASNLAYKLIYGLGIDNGLELAQQLHKRAAALVGSIKDAIVYFCYDCDGKTFRHDLYPNYKNREQTAEREIAKEGLKLSVPYVKQVAYAIQRDGYEADDLIASLVRQTRLDNDRSCVISSDKDLIPLLVYANVVIYRKISLRGNVVYYDEIVDNDFVWQKWGVEPHQWLDYRTIMGDKSDTIDGINGWGAKTVPALLAIEGPIKNWNFDELIENAKGKNVDRLKELRDKRHVLSQMYQLVDSLDVAQH